MLERRKSTWRIAVVIALSAPALSKPAASQQTIFTPSGFSLSVPDGYKIRTYPSKNPYESTSLTVDLIDLKFVKCNVVLQRKLLPLIIANDRPLSSTEIQARLNTRWLSLFSSSLGHSYIPKNSREITIDGVSGVELTGDASLSGEKLAVFRIELTKDSWVANVQCATDKGDLENRRSQFGTVAQGISFPK